MSKNFDITFEARQRWNQMRQRYAIPLILVNGVVQYAGNFDSSLKFQVYLWLYLWRTSNMKWHVWWLWPHLMLVKNEVKSDLYTFTTLLNGVKCERKYAINYFYGSNTYVETDRKLRSCI